MIWFWGVLCALALVALFFPFVFWIDFEADLNRVEVRFRLFKKEIYTYRKSFKKESEETEDLFESSVSAPVENKAVSKPAPQEEKKDEPVKEQEQKLEIEKKAEPEMPVEPEIKKTLWFRRNLKKNLKRNQKKKLKKTLKRNVRLRM